MIEDYSDELDDDEIPPFEPDPRIQEMVEYAVTGIELVLNAEFLLDEWVTAYLRQNAWTAYIYRHRNMSSEQKFALAAKESGLDEDDEYGGRVVCGFLLALYRLRARARCLSDEDLMGSLIEAYVEHWGEEVREECYLPLRLTCQVVTDHLAYAQGWFSIYPEELPRLDDPNQEFIKDPGWEPRGGGSCNFITD